jgi:hypothetical protein
MEDLQAPKKLGTLKAYTLTAREAQNRTPTIARQPKRAGSPLLHPHDPTQEPPRTRRNPKPISPPQTAPPTTWRTCRRQQKPTALF